MTSDSGERCLAPISGVLLLVVGLGGAFFLERPFQSLRPQGEPFKPLSGNLEDINARLWQDPLQAVYRQKDKRSRVQPTERLEELAAQVGEALVNGGSRLQLLAVMIPGGPYPEDVERRRRRRMAVLSGLAVAGFVPRQSEWLGYFLAPAGSSAKLLVPYEWLEREGPGVDPPTPQDAGLPFQILVLWLDEQSLQTEPLERVAEVFRDVLGEGRGEQRREVRLGLLGPASSGTLHAMLQEQGHTKKTAERDREVLSRLTIFSPWATAAVSLLVDNDAPVETQRRERTAENTTLDEKIRIHLGVREFVSTISRDDELASSLLDELVRRRVCLPDNGAATGRLVLISEWDTFYGRALPHAFVHNPEVRSPEHAKDPCPLEIWRYTYLRGLDGGGPQNGGEAIPQASSRSPQPQNERSGWPSQTKHLERAVGPGQLDGMRRLAAELERRERADGAQVRAIGVLGSDLYDKQLVLQALRPRFPQAVFFTTDLDARLLHPASYPWSHNLVVASSYDLDPRRKPASGTGSDSKSPPDPGSWRIAPFRDAYQVSTFSATLRALGRRPPTEPTPRLFEVGRNGEVELDVSEPHTSLRVSASLLGFGAIGLVFLTLVPARTGRRWLLDQPVFRSHPEWLPPTAVLAFGMSVLALLGWLGTHSLEPLRFADGVSIWPTEMVRAVALVVCWLLLLRAHRELDDNACRLERELGLPDEGQRVLPLRTRWKHWWDRWERLRRARRGGVPYPGSQGPRESLALLLRVCRWVWPDRWKGGTGEEVAVGRCWRRYRRLSDWRYRLERITPMVVGYMVIAVLIANRLGAGKLLVPARGDAAFAADKAVLMASVISMIFLTFFVLDETLMCRTLIRHLRSGPSRWPAKARTELGRRYRLPEEAGATLLDVGFIAERTAVSGRLVIYPFIVFTLMMVARHGIFDGWTWPLGLVVILGLVISLVACCALILRREAEKARHGALGRLRRSLFRALGEDDGEIRNVQEKQLRLAIEEVSHLRRGAFGHWSQHPVLRAVLIPFGSLGLLSLVDVLSYLGL